MGVITIEVLLVGQTARGSSQLQKWLGSRGCDCHFAMSCKEACGLIACSGYDLVLSEYDLPDRAAYPLLEQLIGSTSTLFLSTIVEEGFLWVPALLRGRRWPDAHMLRPGELSEALSDVLQRVRGDRAETGPINRATTLGDELKLEAGSPAPSDACNWMGFKAAPSQARFACCDRAHEPRQMSHLKTRTDHCHQDSLVSGSQSK